MGCINHAALPRPTWSTVCSFLRKRLCAQHCFEQLQLRATCRHLPMRRWHFPACTFWKLFLYTTYETWIYLCYICSVNGRLVKKGGGLVYKSCFLLADWWCSRLDLSVALGRRLAHWDNTPQTRRKKNISQSGRGEELFISPGPVGGGQLGFLCWHGVSMNRMQRTEVYQYRSEFDHPLLLAFDHFHVSARVAWLNGFSIDLFWCFIDFLCLLCFFLN